MFSLLLLFFILSRNYRLTCQQLPGLDLSAWQSDEEPEFTTESFEGEQDGTSVTPHSAEEISEDIIKEAIEKAKINLNERAKFEYESWLNGIMLKFFNFALFFQMFLKEIHLKKIHCIKFQVVQLMRDRPMEPQLHSVKQIEMLSKSQIHLSSLNSFPMKLLMRWKGECDMWLLFFG